MRSLDRHMPAIVEGNCVPTLRKFPYMFCKMLGFEKSKDIQDHAKAVLSVLEMSSAFWCFHFLVLMIQSHKERIDLEDSLKHAAASSLKLSREELQTLFYPWEVVQIMELLATQTNG